MPIQSFNICVEAVPEYAEHIHRFLPNRGAWDLIPLLPASFYPRTCYPDVVGDRTENP